MKHIIKVVVIEEDGFAIVYIDNKRIQKDGWDYSYCEHCDEMAYALKTAFDAIKDEPIEYIEERISTWEEYNEKYCEE